MYKEMTKIHKKISKLDTKGKDMLQKELLPIQYSLMVKWYDTYIRYKN
jgi:hypothetical protein